MKYVYWDENFEYVMDADPDHIDDFREANIGNEYFLFHSFNDEPAIKYYNTKEIDGISDYWMHQGVQHREIGPCSIGRHRIEWRVWGKYHRYDGPAIVTGNFGFRADWKNIDPKNIRQFVWAINNVSIDEIAYKNWLDEMDMDINNLSDKDKVIIDLKWG